VRFSQVHKFAVFTLAVLGLVALGAGGEMPMLSLGLTAVGVFASWFVEGELLQSERYGRAWNIALVLALAAQVSRALFFGAEALLTIVEFAALLQVNRLANRRTARDYQQITLLAILQLIAATVLGGGLSYALCFVGFVIATPWAMTLGHLRREIEGNYLADARAGRAGVPIDVARILRSRRVVGVGLLAGSSVLAVPIFLLTAVIFVLFPRIGLGILTVRSRADTVMAGFGNSVDLSGHGTIRSDQTIVLRVQPPNLPANPPLVRTFRLRGTTFDTYNGTSWSRRPNLGGDQRRVDREGTLYSLTRLPDPDRDLAVRIVLDPLEPPVVPVLDGAVGFRIDARFEGGFPRYADLIIDHDDGIRYSSNDGIGLVYTAFLGAAPARPMGRRRLDERRADFNARYLQLPADLSPRVRDLTQRVMGAETTTLGRARAVERHLARWRYTLELESGGAARPLEDFLFRTRAGHCEYFSTAMAVMLRTAGIPTRNVTGFLGGTFNRYGRFYAVRQGDAHSWVEVWDANDGWVTFDPTPPASEMAMMRTGVIAELDAVVEALRMRWRHYVVDFDLGMQAQLARRVWRFVEQRRRHDTISGRVVERGRTSIASRSVPWKRLAGVGLGALTLGALAWQLYAWRRIGRDAHGAPPSAAVKDAQQLARALDLALVARGVARPANRTPLAWAQELTRRGDPMAPLATRAAERYTAARFGADALTRAELDALKAELRSAASQAPSAPSAPSASA
jgi:transglutaminase-like putative cysteine protease